MRLLVVSPPLPILILGKIIFLVKRLYSNIRYSELRMRNPPSVKNKISNVFRLHILQWKFGAKLCDGGMYCGFLNLKIICRCVLQYYSIYVFEAMCAGPENAMPPHSS